MLPQRALEEERVFEVIQSQNAVIKKVSLKKDYDYSGDNTNVLWLINQLVDPARFRDDRHLHGSYKYLTYKYLTFDPRDGSLHYRCNERNDPRKSPKNIHYTKKTAVTLMPADGKIALGNSKNTTYLIFDVRKCHLKNEKYIFSEKADTNKKWWRVKIGIPEEQQRRELKRSMTLAALQQQLAMQRAQGIVPQENELAIGLSKESLVGIYVHEENVKARVRAIVIRDAIENLLEIKLPILIISADNDFKLYSESEQKSDIRILSMQEYCSSPKWFYDHLRILAIPLSYEREQRVDLDFSRPSDVIINMNAELIYTSYDCYNDDLHTEVIASINISSLVLTAFTQSEIEVEKIAHSCVPSEIIRALKIMKTIQDKLIHDETLFKIADHSFTLYSLVRTTKNTYDDVDSDPYKRAYIKLLKQLTQATLSSYSLSRHEFMMLESHLLFHIDCLKTLEQVTGFWDKYAEAAWFNIKPSHFLGGIFSKKSDSASLKDKLYPALSDKCRELGADIDAIFMQQKVSIN